ncbi:hypothetical protein EXS62_00560 [Candidatus Kaiserbacteria bacterium]|nr:hypothetical protein [Candidatus Kaiserbacteria bacterium]
MARIGNVIFWIIAVAVGGFFLMMFAAGIMSGLGTQNQANGVSVTDSNPIGLHIINEQVKLGDTITVVWDSTRIPPNARGMGLHIVRPDHNYVSGVGVVGIDPRLGSYQLQKLPSEPFYGFVDGGEYYVSALVTDTADPNGNILMKADSDSFRIISQ